MRILVLAFLCCLVTHSFAQTNYRDFSLRYSYAGLGSNLGSMQPMFKVDKLSYVYTLQQNSSYTGEFAESEFVCSGVIPRQVVDNILALVENIKEEEVYRFNPNYMSGGIHTICIQCEALDVTFKLHNATDPRAEKIVALLNTCIPENQHKLWLWKD